MRRHLLLLPPRPALPAAPGRWKSIGVQEDKAPTAVVVLALPPRHAQLPVRRRSQRDGVEFQVSLVPLPRVGLHGLSDAEKAPLGRKFLLPPLGLPPAVRLQLCFRTGLAHEHDLDAALQVPEVPQERLRQADLQEPADPLEVAGVTWRLGRELRPAKAVEGQLHRVLEHAEKAAARLQFSTGRQRRDLQRYGAIAQANWRYLRLPKRHRGLTGLSGDDAGCSMAEHRALRRFFLAGNLADVGGPADPRRRLSLAKLDS
eukprot:scaffold1152_cov235-Pinguiococcus_pyrenoidosus.AAC.7